MSKAVTKATPVQTVVYVGPTIPSIASHNTVLNNGITKELQQAIEKEPAFGSLLVSVSELAAASSDIANKRGAIYVFYEKALNYKA